MKSKILLIAITLLTITPYTIVAQSTTGRKIERAGKDMENTENTIEKGKELIDNLFKKKNRTNGDKEESEGNHEGGESPYYMEFTIGGEHFFLDDFNDPDWLGLHAEKDRENDYLSFVRINALKTGYLNKKGKTGAIDFVIAPKDRHVKNQIYSFEKGGDAYSPLITFYFDLGDTNYATSKPIFETSGNTQSYVHTIAGQITFVRAENTKDGIVEGNFRLEGIQIKKNKKLISEGNVAEGKFRMPISIGQRMSN